MLLLRDIAGDGLELRRLTVLVDKDLINPQVPTNLPPWPDDPMLENARRVVGTKPPDVLQDPRSVHVRDEWPERSVKQFVTPFAKISTVGLTDKCEDAVRTPAADEALVRRYGAMSRVTPGSIRGGSLLGHPTPGFSKFPAHRSKLGNELFFGLVLVPHADPGVAHAHKNTTLAGSVPPRLNPAPSSQSAVVEVDPDLEVRVCLLGYT